jgi:hypothetical protein
MRPSQTSSSTHTSHHASSTRPIHQSSSTRPSHQSFYSRPAPEQPRGRPSTSHHSTPRDRTPSPPGFLDPNSDVPLWCQFAIGTPAEPDLNATCTNCHNAFHSDVVRVPCCNKRYHHECIRYVMWLPTNYHSPRCNQDLKSHCRPSTAEEARDPRPMTPSPTVEEDALYGPNGLDEEWYEGDYHRED